MRMESQNIDTRVCKLTLARFLSGLTAPCRSCHYEDDEESMKENERDMALERGMYVEEECSYLARQMFGAATSQVHSCTKCVSLSLLA